jgi:transposase
MDPAPSFAIGVGIDTARYGHRVCFLRPDRQPAAKPLTVTENRAGYDVLQQRLEELRRQPPQAHFHVRIDAAGQYANNLEAFLRGLPGPMTISVGEPKRNKDYQHAHFPKRQTDDTESQAMARFAIVEQPGAPQSVPAAMMLLREVAGRLPAQARQTRQIVNRLHNLMARVFPELATVAPKLSAAWVLTLLKKYPTATKIAQAQLSSLEKIPCIKAGKAQVLQQAAKQSVGSLQGDVAEPLVQELVPQVRHSQAAERKLRDLLSGAYAALPPGNHHHLLSIPGIGAVSAAILVAKIIDIERFQSPEHLVGYFGIFPEERSSGVDKQGRPLPTGTRSMSAKGNDLVRAYLFLAARSGLLCKPALKALYRRLKAKGQRGDVALGHCMRKLLHLVFAIWKTGKPFDKQHFPWEANTETTESAADATRAQKQDVGHTQEPTPATPGVTTPSPTVPSESQAVHAPRPQVTPAPTARPVIDFAFLRQQITLEQILQHLRLFETLHGRRPQLRGPCPLHEETNPRCRTFSVPLQKNVYQCFEAQCGSRGNALDFWAAYHRLPLYEAALHWAETFRLPRNREEEPVKRR